MCGVAGYLVFVVKLSSPIKGTCVKMHLKQLFFVSNAIQVNHLTDVNGFDQHNYY